MLSVVVPVYNEAENIRRLFDSLAESVSVPFELWVVYDFDEDTTIPAILACRGSYRFPIRLVRNAYGRGVLNAIRTGLEQAPGAAVLVAMADLSDDLRVVDGMYDLIIRGGADVVCGSRYMPGGRQIGGPRLKGTLSRLAGLSLYYLAGVPTRDATNSFKMYRRGFLDGITIESTGGFEVGLELVAKAFVGGGRIAELPSTWTDRVAGTSRFMLRKWLPKYIRWYLFAMTRGGLARMGGAASRSTRAVRGR